MAAGELNERQKRFVLEYLKNGGNGTEAAIAAGYSPRSAAVQASRLLNDDKVLAYKRVCARQVFNALGITPAQIGLELWGVYRKCLEAEPHMRWDTDAHAWVPDGTWMFDARGATRALELLGKMEGAFRERVEIEGQPLRVEMTLADKQKRLMELLHGADGDD